MRLLPDIGICDCHSHVFGPFDRFPLSDTRAFTPDESPIAALEDVWSQVGVDRAVLIQGSAHGFDNRAMLSAISLAPDRRRGIALVPHDISDVQLSELHEAGIRGIRFNWVRHILLATLESEATRLLQAAELLERIHSLGWHAELHLDVDDLPLIQRLSVPAGMPLVIDHIARADANASDFPSQIKSLLTLLDHPHIWFKVSGADRVTHQTPALESALPLMRALASEAPDRLVWGLDWPHVNLPNPRADRDLAELLLKVSDDESTLRKILISNPEELYGFPAHNS